MNQLDAAKPGCDGTVPDEDHVSQACSMQDTLWSCTANNTWSTEQDARPVGVRKVSSRTTGQVYMYCGGAS